VIQSVVANVSKAESANEYRFWVAPPYIFTNRDLDGVRSSADCLSVIWCRLKDWVARNARFHMTIQFRDHFLMEMRPSTTTTTTLFCP
jgi:hypothetical protein